MLSEREITNMASAAWFRFRAKTSKRTVNETRPHSTIKKTSSFVSNLMMGTRSPRLKKTAKRSPSTKRRNVESMSFIGRKDKEVAHIVSDLRQVSIRGGEILETMLRCERVMAQRGFYTFYHSVGSDMFKMLCFVTAFARKFDPDLQNMNCIILRLPEYDISHLPVQEIIDTYLHEGDVESEGRWAVTSVVLSATNKRKGTVLVNASSVHNGQRRYQKMNLDPEVTIPQILEEDSAYDDGPESTTSASSSRVRQLMTGILLRSGTSPRTSARVAECVCNLAVPHNNLLQLFVHKDVVDNRVFVTTNGATNAFLFGDTVSDAMRKREPIALQGRIVNDYALMSNDEYWQTQVYSTTNFDFNKHVEKVMQELPRDASWIRKYPTPTVASGDDDDASANRTLKSMSAYSTNEI